MMEWLYLVPVVVATAWVIYRVVLHLPILPRIS